MAIPTYWARSEGWQEGDAVYDHPTPLSSQGTLGRALSSLARLEDDDFSLVVVAAATAPEIAPQVRQRVEGIIADARPEVPTTLFDQRDLDALRRRLEEQGHGGLTGLLSLRGYGNIRNICLALAQMSEADAVLLIDDDEVFEDPSFVGKVRAALASGVKGLAGYYVGGDGAYLLVEPEAAWDRQWGKISAMNRAFHQVIGAPPRIKETPFVFGGNMTITAELFHDVPFDPHITRGEDIDYLINARFRGHRFYLDNELAITHLPDPHSHPAWRQLKQDAVRYAYQRDKLAGAGLDPALFDPYPGPFLTRDLRPRLMETCRLLAEEYRQEGDDPAVAHVQDLAVEMETLEFPDAYAEFLAFEEQWRELMTVL